MSRVQDNLAVAINQLTADDDLIRSPVVRFASSGTIPVGAAVVVYAGGPTQTLTLPPAAAQGKNVGCVLLVLNTSASAVTLARSAADLLAGGATASLAAGALAILASDGASNWCKAP